MLAALTGIAASDDGCGESGAGSLVGFAATVGTTYSIRIDGARAARAGRERDFTCDPE